MTERDDDETDVDKALPSPGRLTAFLVVLGGRTAGEVVRLEKPNYLIGRAEEADICLPDRGVSGTHAVVRVDGEGDVSIQDLQSTNGTRVNEHRITTIRILADGDKISMGAASILKFTHDDTVARALAAQFSNRGTIDPLTGACRERHFRERLKEDFARAIRQGTPLALAVISIDHFDQLRTDQGSERADKVLAEFGRRTRAILRADQLFGRDQLLGRLGRRTFGLLFRGETLNEARSVTNEVRMALSAAPVDLGDRKVAVTLSAGVAALPFVGIRHARELLRMADIGLMDAKQIHDCVMPSSSPK